MLLLICPGSKGEKKKRKQTEKYHPHVLNSLSFKASCTVQVLLQLLDVFSIPWDGKGKSERTEGIPTEMKINRTNKNKSQEEKSLLKDILGSKTVCPLICFAFLTENTVRFGKATMPQKKASALFKVIYVSQLFILPLIL